MVALLLRLINERIKFGHDGCMRYTRSWITKAGRNFGAEPKVMSRRLLVCLKFRFYGRKFRHNAF